MRKTTTQLLLVLAGTFLFDFCFWQEKMGVNTLMFAVFFVAALAWIFPDSLTSRGFQATAAGVVLTAGMVVWHNSWAAKFAFFVSVVCAAGFAQERALRYLLYGAAQYAWGWWQAPRHFFNALYTGNGAGRGRAWRRWLGLAVMPLLVTSVFYGLYYLANDKFAAMSDAFWRQVGRILAFDVSVPHLFFVLFAFFFVGAAFWRNETKLAHTDQSDPDTLTRVRPPRKRYIERFDMLGLRREYRQSLILLWMLNLLLLLVNMTDLRYVWFGFDEAARQNLKGYVHEGTYFLIASILLAMGVLFYVFRRNLHFFPKNNLLRYAAAGWLAQNALLAVSVGLRNWRYIDYHGLAYKRIGVVLFLALTLFGLATLWVKIDRKRTFYWLWRQNSWALYGLLLFNACISWDVFITRYNLSGRPKGAIDVQFMLQTMSDKNLFLLEQNAGVLTEKVRYPNILPEEIQRLLEQKRERFDRNHANHSWKSWNAADACNGGF